MTLEELMQRYGEVEFLLRSPLKSDDDVSAAFEASKASLAFIEEITQLATKSGENRGMLMRWILPYDASTSLSDQSNIAAAGSFAGSGTGSAVSAEDQTRFSSFTDAAAKQRLTDGALQLRKLVRVKLSDEADLQQATVSIKSVHEFLTGLTSKAQEDGSSSYGLLQTL